MRYSEDDALIQPMKPALYAIDASEMLILGVCIYIIEIIVKLIIHLPFNEYVAKPDEFDCEYTTPVTFTLFVYIFPPQVYVVIPPNTTVDEFSK